MPDDPTPRQLDYYYTPPQRRSPLGIVTLILLNTAIVAILMAILVMLFRPGVNQ